MRNLIAVINDTLGSGVSFFHLLADCPNMDYFGTPYERLSVPQLPGDNISVQSRTSKRSVTPFDYEDEATEARLLGSPPLGRGTRFSRIASQSGGSDGLVRGVRLQSMPRQLLWTWLLTLCAIVWISFTVFFAFNCSLQVPISSWLISPNPEVTLFVLSILAHGAVLFLKCITSEAFEAIRWTFASSSKGIMFSSFLGLSRATSIFGVMKLLRSRDKGSYTSPDGHGLWGGQRCSLPRSSNCRIFFLLLHAVLGVLLLSRVTFENSWRPIQSLQFTGSGLTPINASLVNEASPLDFWAWVYGLLASPNYAVGVPPVHCSGTNCSSYFLPGAIYTIDGTYLPLSFHPEAPLLVLDNSIGYQIEYYPLAVDDAFVGASCKSYGLNPYAVSICIKQSGTDLLAGKCFL